MSLIPFVDLNIGFASALALPTVPPALSNK